MNGAEPFLTCCIAITDSVIFNLYTIPTQVRCVVHVMYTAYYQAHVKAKEKTSLRCSLVMTGAS